MAHTETLPQHPNAASHLRPRRLQDSVRLVGDGLERGRVAAQRFQVDDSDNTQVGSDRYRCEGEASAWGTAAAEASVTARCAHPVAATTAGDRAAPAAPAARLRGSSPMCALMHACDGASHLRTDSGQPSWSVGGLNEVCQAISDDGQHKSGDFVDSP